MAAWQELKAEIDRQVELTTLQPDQDVEDVFKYSISKGGAGIPHDNQIFTTWWYGAPDVTYVADWIYFLIALAQDGESYPMSELCKMARFWFVQPSHFGDYSGMYKQYDFTKKIDAILDDLDREAFIALLSSFRNYIMNMNVWIYQFWPWGVGYAFKRKDRAYYEAGLALSSGK